MAWSQEQLDQIESAIAEGVLEVQYKDKKVTYRSLEEMLKVRDLMRQSLGKLSSSGGRGYFKTSKGLE